MSVLIELQFCLVTKRLEFIHLWAVWFWRAMHYAGALVIFCTMQSFMGGLLTLKGYCRSFSLMQCTTSIIDNLMTLISGHTYNFILCFCLPRNRHVHINTCKLWIDDIFLVSQQQFKILNRLSWFDVDCPDMKKVLKSITPEKVFVEPMRLFFEAVPISRLGSGSEAPGKFWRLTDVRVVILNSVLHFK